MTLRIRIVGPGIALALGLVLTACAAEPTPTPTPSPTATATPTSLPTATATPTPTPAVTPTPALPEGAVSVSLHPSKDNTLIEDAEGLMANGSGQYIFAGRTNQPAIRRALVAFDVASAIPAGATIHSAALTLHMSRTGNPLSPSQVELYQVTASWSEGATKATGNEGRGLDVVPGDATWVHRSFDDQLWGTPGGDFVSGASAAVAVLRKGPYVWGSTDQMVADVQLWLDDSLADHGWLLRGDETINRNIKRFDSRENEDEANRPVLTVVYIPAPGQ